MTYVDDKDFQKKARDLVDRVNQNQRRANLDVGKEILRLSNNYGVPHDKGTLQNSGHCDPDAPADDVVVGYNTVYAARLHEHPEYRFQKGRRGKYLENPILENLRQFKEFFSKIISG